MVQLLGTFFDWVASQAVLTGAVILAAGLLYTLYGFRMIRCLLVLSAGGLGCLIGLPLAAILNMETMTILPVTGICTGLGALIWPRAGVVFCSATTWAGYISYIAAQLTSNPNTVWVAAGIGGCTGFVLAVLSRQAMSVGLMSLHGALLTALGFVGVMSAALPAVGATFRSWADQPFVVPGILAMLAATGYSIQEMHRQGDIRTGAQAVVRL